jgi:hypothetical protein
MFRNVKKIIALTVLLAFLVSGTVFAFNYSGLHWSSSSAYYKYRASLPSAWQTQVYNAAGTWNNASKFKLYYSTSCSNSWGAANYGLSGAAGYTTNQFTGQILNYCYSDYNTYYSFASNGDSTKYDLRTVALHEFGHWGVLDDIYNSDFSTSVMYYTINKGQLKRSLTSDDISGIRYIYGV